MLSNVCDSIEHFRVCYKFYIVTVVKKNLSNLFVDVNTDWLVPVQFLYHGLQQS